MRNRTVNFHILRALRISLLNDEYMICFLVALSIYFINFSSFAKIRIKLFDYIFFDNMIYCSANTIQSSYFVAFSYRKQKKNSFRCFKMR